MDRQFPTWLKAMQNGSIGEARTRAFLLDRFWVLERSVDIQGADFLIQRRLTAQNLLDHALPRFGIVQSKFFDSEHTTALIPKQYVINGNSGIRKEFFLVCHFGTSDRSRMHLLTADDLVADFCEASDGKIRVPGSVLLNEKKYEVVSSSLALERMERILAQVDVKDNRVFVSQFIPNIAINLSDIDVLYQEPIHNWWGDVPEAFADMRKIAKEAIYRLDDARVPLQKILEATDPEAALAIAEQMVSTYGESDPICIYLPSGLYSEEFHRVVLNHKKCIATLRESGLLDVYIEMQVQINAAIASDLALRLPMDKNTVYQVQIDYSPTDFSNLQINGSVLPAENFSKSPSVRDQWGNVELCLHIWCQSAIPGQIVYCWTPGRYSYVDKDTATDWESYIKNKRVIPITPIMESIFELRFPQ